MDGLSDEELARRLQEQEDNAAYAALYGLPPYGRAAHAKSVSLQPYYKNTSVHAFPVGRHEQNMGVTINLLVSGWDLVLLTQALNSCSPSPGRVAHATPIFRCEPSSYSTGGELDGVVQGDNDDQGAGGEQQQHEQEEGEAEAPMTYEDMLALGELAGNVSKGLPEEVVHRLPVMAVGSLRGTDGGDSAAGALCLDK